MLVRGEKPAAFPAANKAITKRDWKHSLRSKKDYPNPIKIGCQFVQYFKDYPDSTYDDLSEMFDVSKAIVCQMVALYNRLPSQITEYLMNNR